MSSGLTRRRGAGATASADTGSPVPSNRDTGAVSVETVYDKSESGHKIAYDPRDMNETAERSKQPPLTIMEEVLLLGLKDKDGHLSFWNDTISYALRGCIVMELAFRGRISIVKERSTNLPLPDRIIEVVDDTPTSEVLLDEALKMMKTSEKLSIASWIDLMSGETWNVMKIGYQLKQVRERLAKGLVDKGILRTEKRNYLLFDMATHPVADSKAKDEIRSRVRTILTQRTVMLEKSEFLPEKLPLRYLRSVAMVCAAHSANVLENALAVGFQTRERAFEQVERMLGDYAQWPFGKKAVNLGIAENLPKLIADEINQEENKNREQHLMIVAACIQVFCRAEDIL